MKPIFANRASGLRWQRQAALLAACAALVATAPTWAVSVTAADAGFVTEMGGSAKGDGTVVSVAKYNYSVGFEVHYTTGALSPPPYAPMVRKNYFVFDLSAVALPIAGAALKLWTGTFESTDPVELYALHGPAHMPTALTLAADLAAGTSTTEFDSPGDALVVKAKDLFDMLAMGPLLAPPFAVSSALDDSFIDIVLSPAGVAYLSGFIGGKVLLSGLVPTIDGSPPMTPQQPFGFTGPDIAAGDPLTPVLTLTLVPEPPAALLLLAGVGGLLLLSCRQAGDERRP